MTEYMSSAFDSDTALQAVLVVDDNEDNLALMREILSEIDAEVLTASSGKKAIEIAMDRDDIAMILLDVQMPEMDGYQTAQILRRTTSKNTIPIIFVSGIGNEERNISLGYESGAVDFLLKPVSEFVLLSKVNVFLEMDRQKNALRKEKENKDQLVTELKRSNRELDDFSHVVSHDFKSPLRQIRAFAALLVSDEANKISEDSEKYLDYIVQTSTDMQNLLDGLLTYARLDGGCLTPAPVNLTEVVSDVRTQLQFLLEEVGGTVNIGELPPVLGDKVLLKQLFQNLLENSLKYRREDVKPIINISMRPSQPIAPQESEKEGVNGENLRSEQVRIVVEDNGIGFDQMYAKRIFEPFRRLVTRTEYEGSGIGLATVKKIVERHNGAIEAHGTEGQGATFTITLPTSGNQIGDIR